VEKEIDMKVKKIIGYTLSLIAFALFTGVLVKNSNLITVMAIYGFLILTMCFIFLIFWLLNDDE